MSMSAHVPMRRQDRQDDTTEELPEKLLKTQHPVTCPHAMKTDGNAVTNQRAESKGKRWHPRDSIVVCAVQTRPSTESRALLTNRIRTWFISLSQGCSNVVLPFLHTVRTFPSS